MLLWLMEAVACPRLLLAEYTGQRQQTSFCQALRLASDIPLPFGAAPQVIARDLQDAPELKQTRLVPSSLHPSLRGSLPRLEERH